MATAQAANELKQQGAIEASRDPDSNVSAADAERKIVEDSREAGVTAFTFDPDASPEEKRAQARAVCCSPLARAFPLPCVAGANCGQAIPEGFHRNPKGVAIVTDIDDGTKADVDLPTPSKAGAIEVVKDQNGKPLANGQIDEDDEDDWGKTGWEPRFGWPTEPANEGESMLDHTTLIESQLSEKFFGGKPPMSHREFAPGLTIWAHRLVPQRSSHWLCLPRLMAGSCAWRRSRLGVHRHGHLLDILPDFAPPSAPKLPRRHHTRNGSQEAGHGQRVC